MRASTKATGKSEINFNRFSPDFFRRSFSYFLISSLSTSSSLATASFCARIKRG